MLNETIPYDKDKGFFSDFHMAGTLNTKINKWMIEKLNK